MAAIFSPATDFSVNSEKKKNTITVNTKQR